MAQSNMEKLMQEIEQARKKCKNLESQVVVLNALFDSLKDEQDELNKKAFYAREKLYELELNSLVDIQERVDYVLDLNKASNYIERNLNTILPNGVVYHGINSSSLQRRLALNIDLEPSLNAEKIDFLMQYMKEVDLEDESMLRYINGERGKILELMTTRFSTAIEINKIDNEYHVHVGVAHIICKAAPTIKDALNALSDFLDMQHRSPRFILK